MAYIPKLVNLCMDSFLEFLVKEDTLLYAYRESAAFCLPVPISNLFVSKLLSRMCNKQVKINVDYMVNRIEPFLKTRQVTHLDFSPFSCSEYAFSEANGYSTELSNLKYSEIEKFKHSFLRMSPCLEKLEYLSFETSTTSSLHVCDDEILCSIGKYCGSLKQLNIANNKQVTDIGLINLVPSSNNQGCPKLESLMIQGCGGISPEGVMFILSELENIKNINYMDMGRVLMLLHEENKMKETVLKTLNLESVTHTPYRDPEMKYSIDIMKLTQEMASCMSAMCPKIKKLVVEIDTENCAILKKFSNISKLVLFSRQNIMGSVETVQYFTSRGAQLTSLVLDCVNLITGRNIVFLGENCPKLKELRIGCWKFDQCINVGYHLHSTSNIFSDLNVFEFSVSTRCDPSVNYFCYLLQNSHSLTSLYFGICSIELGVFAVYLFDNIDTRFLQSVTFVNHCRNTPKLCLTLDYIEYFLAKCPALKKLADLKYWDLDFSEILRVNSPVELVCT